MTPRAPRRTGAVLVIAFALLLGILIARLANSDPSNGILALQVIPIALVALELGLIPALAVAGVALGTVAVWDATSTTDLGPVDYVFRAAVYFPIAFAVGWIAGRLRISQELTQRQARRLRSIVESSSDALVTMDEDGRILAWNPVAERMFGWTADEVLGKDLGEVTMPPNIRELMRVGKRRFLEEDDRSMMGVRFESRALTRDGRKFPIECSISPVREEDHWIFHIFGHDITERKASEEERNRLASIVDSTGDAILSFTLDGRITSWNSGAEWVYGYSEREALGMSLGDFVPPDRPDDVAPLIERVARGGQIDNLEFERIGKGGRQVEVSVTVTPLEGSSGYVVGGAAIHRDISERKRRERYLAAQHGATRLLAQLPELDEVGPAILPLIAGAGGWLCAAYWTASHGTLTCASTWTAPATEALVNPNREGSTAPHGTGQETLRWIGASAAARTLPTGERAVLGGLRTQLWAPVAVDGELCGAFQFFDRREREQDRELVGALGAITDQIANYVQRRRAEEAAERAKDEFFGLVSHELRTPLTSIVGYGELLAESEADRLTPEGRRYLEVMRRNAQREVRLVGDLLLLVRIQEGTFRLELEDVDLEPIVEHSVEAARPAAAKRGVELVARTDPVPVLPGDAHRLGQVVDNLLSNAIKFTPKGGQVTIHLGTADGLAAIAVSDTGAGIPPDEQKRLFDRLYRAPSAMAAAVPGVGLGLTIVKAIVDAHEGRILVESEPGQGATFRVELPVQGPRHRSEEGG